MTVSVRMLTFTLSSLTNGATGHRISGRSQRWTRQFPQSTSSVDSASLRAGPAATSTESCSHYRIRSENEQGGRYGCRDRQIPALEQCRLELERDAEAADHDVGDAQVGDEIVGDGLNNHVRLCKVPGPGHDSEQEYEETVRSLYL